MTVDMPRSKQAEWTLVGQMLTNSQAVAEVIGQQLEPDDFYHPDVRLIFEAASECYYADQPVDPVTVGERLRDPLASHWSCAPDDVSSKLYGFVAGQKYSDGATHHAQIVKALGDKRRLLILMDAATQRLQSGDDTPGEVGDFLASEAARITAGRATRSEILTWMDVGREYTRHLKMAREARAQGREIGVYTGMKFFDDYTRGIAPTELLMVGGEPGVGKSAVCWAAAEGFARRQAAAVRGRNLQPVSTLVLSMEMGLIPSSARLVTAQSGIDGARLREGEISAEELQRVAADWAAKKELPLHFNFASNFKLSQLRALIVEGIRKHNVGFVVLDHFRMVDPDRRVNNQNQEDELKARFLKEEICKDLNVAVMCLAHTVKMKREGSDGRPSLSDLRGSYQVAAHCDMVSFVFRPAMYADEDDLLYDRVKQTDAEMIWAKNRNGALGTRQFFFDAANMIVK